MKYTITKAPKTPNTIWDAKKGQTLCKFINGVIETDDADLAKRLADLGHTVTKDADGKADADKDDSSVDGDADGKADADKDDEKKTASKGRRSRTAK